MKVLITSGGTKIPIDTVRDITNMSTGTFGTKIAEALLRKGHEISFVRAKGSKSPMRRVIDLWKELHPYDITIWAEERSNWRARYNEWEYKTFEQYERTLQLAIGNDKPDVVVLAAAVSDYHVSHPMNGKLRSNDMLTLKLESLPKIINKVKGLWAPEVKLVGFKLLVGSTMRQLIAASEKSIVENKCDMVVANDLEDIKRSQHKVIVVRPNTLPITYNSDPNDPDFLAKKIAEHIEQL